MPKVTFLDEVVTVEAKSGQTLKEVAEANGIALFRGLWRWGNCRGLGMCGACGVWVNRQGAPVIELAGVERANKKHE